MKNPIFKISLIVCTIASAMSSCSNDPAKTNSETNKTAEVKAEDKNIQVEEFENYKKEKREKITANEKIIADLKARVNMSKQEARDNYNKKIEVLEKRNNELKAKLELFEGKTSENWNEFKTEFNHDMQELGNAFEDFTKENVK